MLMTSYAIKKYGFEIETNIIIVKFIKKFGHKITLIFHLIIINSLMYLSFILSNIGSSVALIIILLRPVINNIIVLIRARK
jgi:hypothetical protein